MLVHVVDAVGNVAKHVSRLRVVQVAESTWELFVRNACVKLDANIIVVAALTTVAIVLKNQYARGVTRRRNKPVDDARACRNVRDVT